MTAMKYFGATLSIVILAACGRASFQNSQRAGLEDFMEGASAVAIGMTEAEVSQALGAQPDVRTMNH